jgi:hypothetical protein
MVLMTRTVFFVQCEFLNASCLAPFNYIKCALDQSSLHGVRINAWVDNEYHSKMFGYLSTWCLKRFRGRRGKLFPEYASFCRQNVDEMNGMKKESKEDAHG